MPSKKKNKERKVIFVWWFRTKNGKIIRAADYGHEAFRIFV